MQSRYHQWAERIKRVERDFLVMRLAADRLLVDAKRDPTVLRQPARPHDQLSPRDVGHASDGLEGTYVIRLFAEFETALRLYWPTSRSTAPPRQTHDLIEG